MRAARQTAMRPNRTSAAAARSDRTPASFLAKVLIEPAYQIDCEAATGSAFTGCGWDATTRKALTTEGSNSIPAQSVRYFFATSSGHAARNGRAAVRDA